jgi:hypothetical protein
MMVVTHYGSSAPVITPYLYYRINVTAINGAANLSCQQLEMLDGGAVDRAVSPVSSGTATGSSFAPFPGFGFAQSFQHQLHDGSVENGWTTSGTATGILEWQSAAPIDVSGVSVTGLVSFPARMPQDFTIEYSDNDIAWTVATTVVGQTAWGAGEVRYFPFASVGAHQYWRLNCTLNNGDANTGICSLRLNLAGGGVVNNLGAAAIARYDTHLGDFFTGRIFQTQPNPGWIGLFGTPAALSISMPVATALSAIAWTARLGEQANAPKDFTILGSNDDVTYTLLKTVVNSSAWSDGERRVFTL